MMTALAFVTLRQWGQHRLRLFLTLAGIALGVAVFFAVRTANTTLDQFAGRHSRKVGGTRHPPGFRW